MIVGDGGPVLVVDGRQAWILRDALRRWKAEHERHGGRQKITAVLPLLNEWEQVADAYAASLMSARGHATTDQAASPERDRDRRMSPRGHGLSEAPSGQGNLRSELTTAQAAEQLGVTVRQVGRLIRAGELTATKPGRDHRVDSVSVEQARQLRTAEEAETT